MAASLAFATMPKAAAEERLEMPRFNELSAGRADSHAYDIYYERMDATARQKVAFTTPHIPPAGAVIADMGMGTGKTTFDLANLYPGNTLFGIDIDPHSIKTATDRYSAANLHFLKGDISTVVLPARSVDALLFSSILHELPCYGPLEERFKFDVVNRVLDSAAEQLKPGGHLIIRDFVAPRGPDLCVLELKNADGTAAGTPAQLSSAALFREFTRTFRSSRYPNGGLDALVQDLGTTADGWQRFKAPLRDAAEFMLRRHYTDRWREELREEYLFWDQEQAERALTERGFRVITAEEIHNPWIRQNRFSGNFRLFDLSGKPLEFPPTNFLLVGEKVSGEAGVGFKESDSRTIASPSYISVSKYRNTAPDSPEFGRCYEVISRPNQTVDLVPWFRSAEGIFVLAKSDYPRPLVTAGHPRGQLDRSTSAGYITEPLNAVLEPKPEEPLRFFDSELAAILRERAAATPKKPGASGDSPYDYRYFTSPGGLDELVLSKFIEIAPQQELRHPHANYSGFAESGTVRPLEARQALRAYQIGGMFDSRLETNIYRLLLREKLPWGPWIGADIALKERELSELKTQSVRTLLASRTAAYEKLPHAEKLSFLELKEGIFSEINSSGTTIAARAIEYAQPAALSNDTISILPVAKIRGEIVVGLEERDLPVPQGRIGNSRILTVPAFRLPRSVANLDEADLYARGKLKADFGAVAAPSSPLGGKYFPSPGVIPETVYPRIAEVTELTADGIPENGKLRWVTLDDLIANHAGILDGHLLTSLFRAAHALARN